MQQNCQYTRITTIVTMLVMIIMRQDKNTMVSLRYHQDADKYRIEKI